MQFTDKLRFLKNNQLILDLNAAIKARQTKERYERWVRQYESMEGHTAEELFAIRAGERLRRVRELRPMRIFWAGNDEQQDRGGIIQALERAGEVEIFTRDHGEYGYLKSAPIEQRRTYNANRLSELIGDLAAQGRAPDLLITQSWGGRVLPDVYSRLRERYGLLVINIGMDDRHQYWAPGGCSSHAGTYALAAHIDLHLTAAPECVDWFLKEGCPAIHWPEASDPGIFHPMPEVPKVHDVSFVGQNYGIRRRIVTALREAGISVTTYGSGWISGRIPTEEVPRLFAQSKIVLGVGTIGYCDDFFALKIRDFDAPMSGSLYITHDNPDLRAMYNVGHEIITYGNVDDCVEKVRYYLAHDTEREQIAHAGRKRAARDHTWDCRFHDLFAWISGGAHVHAYTVCE